ncbi:ferritin-like domain-containing protein [Siphonobacter sp.]|uniref:ferritin-like domain-containing protein n=1 Tax=Siphonobacter sp. TaxID=1869184 RepID=UPI003B3A2188
METTVTNDKLVDVLNDLVRINNDRIAGYEKAVNEAELEDVDLKALFNRFADESRTYRDELSREIVSLGGTPTDETTTSGKFYRVWMDIKAAFSGKDRKAILENCEFGEDAAQEAYQTALESDATMTTDVRQLISTQKSKLKDSHDAVKKYRDLHASLS